MRKAFLLVLRLIIAAAVIIVGISQFTSIFDKQHEQRETSSIQQEAAISQLKSGYDQLKIGMSYEDCVKVIGSEGELFSETETEYFGKSAVYLWTPEGAFITGIEAHFNDGKLSSKTWVE